MEVNDQNKESILSMAQQLEAQGNFLKAVELYKSLTTRNDIPKLHQTLARLFLILGRVDEALFSFKKQLILEPDSAELHFSIGNCFYMLNKYPEAIKAYEKSIELDPNNPYAFDNMANALEEQNTYHQALKLRQKASELQPYNAYIKCSIGNTLYKLNQKNEALEVYKSAAALNPIFPDTHYYMGNCLCSMENYKDAIKSYLTALELNPYYIDALNNIGNAYFDIGNLDNTIKYYQKAKELDPGNPEILNNLGDLYSILGETEEAIECYNFILENYNDELLENLIKKKIERCPAHPLEYVQKRQKHYRKYIGNFSRVMHSISEEKPPFIDIYEIPPQNGRYFWTYITGGMSDIAQTEGSDSNAYTELILYTKEKSLWARKVLYNVAYFPFLNNIGIQYGSTVKFDFPFADDSEMQNVLLLDTKVEEKGFFDFIQDGKKVNFLRILPISDSEMKYKNKHGMSSLMNKFEEAQLDFVADSMRKPII